MVVVIGFMLISFNLEDVNFMEGIVVNFFLGEF